MDGLEGAPCWRSRSTRHEKASAMVRLVDESGAPCALHLAVRDASGEPILELRADSPEWWDFGAVTVLHTPDGRLR